MKSICCKIFCREILMSACFAWPKMLVCPHSLKRTSENTRVGVFFSHCANQWLFSMEKNHFREHNTKLKMENNSFSKGIWIWNRAAWISQHISIICGLVIKTGLKINFVFISSKYYWIIETRHRISKHVHAL